MRIWDPGWKKFGSEIKIPDPQHWILLLFPNRTQGGQRGQKSAGGEDSRHCRAICCQNCIDPAGPVCHVGPPHWLGPDLPNHGPHLRGGPTAQLLSNLPTRPRLSRLHAGLLVALLQDSARRGRTRIQSAACEHSGLYAISPAQTAGGCCQRKQGRIVRRYLDDNTVEPAGQSGHLLQRGGRLHRAGVGGRSVYSVRHAGRQCGSEGCTTGCSPRG